MGQARRYLQAGLGVSPLVDPAMIERSLYAVESFRGYASQRAAHAEGGNRIVCADFLIAGMSTPASLDYLAPAFIRVALVVSINERSSMLD